MELLLGWWTPGQWLRMVVDIEMVVSVSHATTILRGRAVVCLGLDGDLDEDYMGRVFVDPTRSFLGNVKVDLVTTPGRRPGNRLVLVVNWMNTTRAESSSTIIG